MTIRKTRIVAFLLMAVMMIGMFVPAHAITEKQSKANAKKFYTQLYKANKTSKGFALAATAVAYDESKVNPAKTKKGVNPGVGVYLWCSVRKKALINFAKTYRYKTYKDIYCQANFMIYEIKNKVWLNKVGKEKVTYVQANKYGSTMAELIKTYKCIRKHYVRDSHMPSNDKIKKSIIWAKKAVK